MKKLRPNKQKMEEKKRRKETKTENKKMDNKFRIKKYKEWALKKEHIGFIFKYTNVGRCVIPCAFLGKRFFSCCFNVMVTSHCDVPIFGLFMA